LSLPITPKAGHVWDNAAMESFFSYKARADLFDYVERFYNPKRRHSKPGYLSPVELEKKAMQA
jgi:putative transposase